MMRGLARARRGLALVLLLAASGCHATVPPNVLVIVVDTLRADRLGAYGNSRGLTPFLDELAQRGTVFTHAYSTSSWTCPAVASLMTSRDPRQHLVSTFGSRLAPEEHTFAEILDARGYRTGGFSANFRLLQRLGYAQGFDAWRADGTGEGGLAADALRAQAIEWLDQAGSPQPTLLYFQFMEPHGPYLPPEPFRTRFAQTHLTDAEAYETFAGLLSEHRPDALRRAVAFAAQLYDGEVASIDDQLRTLFDQLRQRGFLDHAIVIITADHGEEFFEHGGTTHGRTLFNEVVQIPLIVVAPGYSGGRRIDDNVSIIDIAPTLVDLLELPAERRFEGQSLVRFLQPTSLQARWRRLIAPAPANGSPDVLYRLPSTGIGADQRVHQDGILRGTAKLLLKVKGEREVYDLTADAAEQHPNQPGAVAEAEQLVQALDAHDARLQEGAVVARTETLDDATKEKLRALGYGN